MKLLTLSFVIGTLLSSAMAADDGSGAAGKADPSGSAQQPDRDRLKVTIYPILAWLPVFGVSVNLPSFPNIPASGSGSASASLSGAALAGILIETGNWFVDAEGLWAGLNAERTVAPTLTVDLDILYGHGSVGRRIYKNVFLTGGVRRLALHYDIQLAEFPEFARKPGLWDPLVGLEWKHCVGEKGKLSASVDGGGFGVGSDVDVAGTVQADWKFARHFGVAFGYSALYLKISNALANRTFTARQTIHGPILGFGIYF